MKKGIRRRLIFLFITTAAVECVLMLFVSGAIWMSTNFISSSYNSNLGLQKYGDASQNVFKSLCAYINLKTYDNINSYLRDKAEMERLTLELERKPSASEIKLCEYSVYKFSESFLNYADNAVFLRRQGNFSGAMENFRKAKTAFFYLSESRERLNNLFLENNISRYGNIKNAVGRLLFVSELLIIFSSVMIAGVLSIFVSSITRPLTEISETANKIAERDFDIPLFCYNRPDEIGNICRAFNRMILSIREYIDTIWETAITENELREKEMKMRELYQEAKLTALQAQINPHFLFNTLNTGAQLAMMEGSDHTCDFLEKVADFYRYNLQFSGKESVLEDEIKLLESYVYIMKVRFGDHFNFYSLINTQRLDLHLPGMILQPLVENCIKHGLCGMSKGGKIFFKVYEEGDFTIISVSDNGPGFPEEKRCEILEGNSKKIPESVVKSNDDSGTGVGLVNVISRLRAFYKYDDVFDIGTSSEGGAEFVIRIKNV